MPPRLALPLLLSALARRAACLGPMHHCCRGKHVKVGMPGIVAPPWWAFNGNVTTAGGQFWSFSGFIPKVIEAVLTDMGITVEYYPQQLQGTEVVPRVASGHFDIMLAPSLTQQDPYPDEFVVPVPLFQYVTHVLLKKEQVETSMWQVFAPFTLELWMVVVACVFAAAITLLVIEFVSTGGADFSFSKVVKSVYHAWSAMLGGDDAEWSSPPAKVLRLGLLLLVLVISATYTANLAAFLTDPLIEIKGPKDYSALKEVKVCHVFQGSSPFLGSSVAPPLDVNWDLDTRYNWCYDQLQDGTVEAIIGDSVSSHMFMLKHCRTLARAENLHFQPMTMHLVLSAQNAELGRNLSAALLDYRESPDFNALQTAELRLGEGCSDGFEGSDSKKIHWQSMIGLLFIFLGFIVLAVLVGMVQCIGSMIAKRRGGRKDAPENAIKVSV